jgi:hypothetical protein
MKRITRTQQLLAAALTTLPAVCFAHPGHDHDAWSSPIVHLGFFAALVAVAVVGGTMLRKRFSAQSNNKVKS